MVLYYPQPQIAIAGLMDFSGMVTTPWGLVDRAGSLWFSTLLRFTRGVSVQEELFISGTRSWYRGQAWAPVRVNTWAVNLQLQQVACLIHFPMESRLEKWVTHTLTQRKWGEKMKYMKNDLNSLTYWRRAVGQRRHYDDHSDTNSVTQKMWGHWIIPKRLH